ncbi:OmpA family protein [Flavobacterium faecale]|uniref:OmpA family protein n=1 Tax=Flavobacterium faecale TaxID=1355330 RepID=UPI003AAD0653
MKKIILLLIVFSVQLINAQGQDQERAKRFFERTYYSEAISLYESIAKQNNSLEVLRNLADSYYFINDYVNAQIHYRMLLSKYGKEVGQEYYFRYAQMLKASGNYDEANKIMRHYWSSQNDKVALLNLEKEIKQLENISAIGDRYEIKNLAINTDKSEFGAVKLGQNLIFSRVSKTNLFDKKFKWNNEGYLDVLEIPLDNLNRKDSIAKSFSKDINTSLHESNAVFTKDGKTVYFTRNNYKNGKRGKNKDKVSNLQIFRAEFLDGKWSNIKSLPFNSEDFSVEHPALSPDEKTLYFASDMPGTLGSFDIFSVQILGADYGDPVNLGSTINTNRKEQFPFVSNDNKLYYSSNGLPGYGSLDVFVSQISGNGFSSPINVGLPVNSGYDDFCFTIDSDTRQGYFSSNRKNGKGSDDIYELKEIKPLIVEDCSQFITGVVTDFDTKLPFDQAVVLLQNSDKVELEKVLTTADGAFHFIVPCEASYVVLASKEGFTNDYRALKLNKERKKVNDASMSLRSLDVVKKENQAIIAEKQAQAQARLERQKRDKEVAEKRAVQEAEIKKKEKVANIIAAEKDVVKDKDRLIIKTDPIYFDYDLWYIRKESKPILNRVVDLMKKYPEMVIEIGSHTDNRGNDKYNLNLSANRANSTRDYFLQQGIDKNRIFAKGYGETVQIVKCQPEESCSEEQHELNRRSEFVIKNL